MSDYRIQREWTKQEDEILIRLKKQGHSAAEIGAVVKRSKSAVCGRVYRLGIAEKDYRPRAQYGSRVRAKRRIKRGNIPSAVPPKRHYEKRAPRPRIMKPEIAPESKGMTLDELPPNACKYMAGDPREGGTFCGEKAVRGQSWCAYHYHIVYMPRGMMEAAE